MIFDQSAFSLRFEWGLTGLQELAQSSSVLVVVDVLSFCTAVEIACQRGAFVYPYHGPLANAQLRTEQIDGVMAGYRGGPGLYSLSPTSLLNIPAKTRLVLPSLNGAQLSLAVPAGIPVLAGCLRNAAAVACTAAALGDEIAVIAAGEHWRGDHSFRPSWEDLVGAGAILRHLPGSRSPEAQAAIAAFGAALADLDTGMLSCSSGRELVALGYADDVRLAAELDVSECVPQLKDGAYSNQAI